MFNPTQKDIRNFWFNTYNKSRTQTQHNQNQYDQIQCNKTNQTQNNDDNNYNNNSYNNNYPQLSELEKIAYSIILEHPEYNYIFENQEKYLDYQWLPEDGIINPMLHLALHMAVTEQLSVTKLSAITSTEINTLQQQILQKYPIRHQAEHQLMECLAEMIFHAERSKTPPNIDIYINCIKKKLNK